MDAIPGDVALLLCAAIRQGNRGKWYTLAWLQCWGCTKLAKGDSAKMLLSNREGYRGCKLVNRHHAQISGVQD